MIFAFAFALSFLVTPLAAYVARRVGVVDHPGPLKVHDIPVPYLGGLAIAAALVPAVLAIGVRYALPLGGALVLGLVDDARGIPARARLAIEVGIGALVGVLIPPVALGLVGRVGVAVSAPLLINAINMIDGLDGLAAGVTAASAIGFALVTTGGTQSLALALLGGLLAFLLYNRPPARIYLGDAGSYLLGTSLAVLIGGAARHHPTAIPVTVLLVGVPLCELGLAVVRRKRAGVALFAGDRGHSYDQMQAFGMTAQAAVAVCVSVQLALTAIAVMVSHAAVVVAAMVAVAVAVTVAVVDVHFGFVKPSERSAPT